MKKWDKKYWGALAFLVICGYIFFMPTASEIRQVGYFKSDTQVRIFTFAYLPGLGKTEIRAFAEKLMHTSGRPTFAYFYQDVEDAVIPADGVTLAGSLDAANNILYETPGLSKWRYAYLKAPRGNVSFVDCEETPEDGLCRQ